MKLSPTNVLLTIFSIIGCIWCFIIYQIFFRTTTTTTSTSISTPNSSLHATPSQNNKQHPIKILHIITSSSEYNSGHRSTIRGDDRFQKIVLPALRQLTETASAFPHWHIDVYMILGYTTQRTELIRQTLPSNVGLEIWEDAMPYYYPHGKDQHKLKIATHGLARQHRYVIKDKLEEYDFFSCWEDDMRITADHISNFLELSNELDRLRQTAPSSTSQTTDHHETTLTADQLRRILPGFIRVEVLRENRFPQDQIAPIAVDESVTIDPMPCCGTNATYPKSEQVIMWETGIKGFGVREFPGEILGWMGLMSAVTDHGKNHIKRYWSGEDGAFGEEKPPGRHPHFMAQQGGWMATRDQIRYFDEVCPGGFLPPFDDSMWNGNAGLKPQNVEFWSGQYQLFGRCYIQRVLSLDPKRFSKQLLYHTSNNKQMGSQIGRERLVKADVLLGQLHTVKRAAMKKGGKGYK